MNSTHRLALTGALIVLAEISPSRAGDPIARPNRVSVAARAAFNVQVAFSSRLPASPADPGPATGSWLRTYDNGFVGVDAGENADGRTWYWGYVDAAQVNLEADTIVFQALQAGPPALVDDQKENFLAGAEVTYTRYLLEFGRAFWGLEFGANYTPVSATDTSRLVTTATLIRDTYSLGGILPPLAPYAGTVEGPGPVIGTTPVRAVLTQPVVFAGRRKIEATTWAFRLGPNLEIPMGEPLALQISGGAYLMHTDAELHGAETVTVASAPAGERTFRADRQEWTLGAYVRGQVLWSLTPSLGIFAGAEYLLLDEVELRTPLQRARLDFGESFAAFAGVAITF